MNTKIILIFLLTACGLHANKTDDALAAALAQNKAQALTIQALTKAVAKTNVDAGVRADAAMEQRTATAVAAQVAVSDQKESAVRVETKTDAAVATASAAKSSADEAARVGQSNNGLIYAGLLTSILTFLGVALQSVLKYLSDGRILAAANYHQQEVNSKLDKVTAQTDGIVETVKNLAGEAGYSKGQLDANKDAGRTGD